MAKCQICQKKSELAGNYAKTRGQYNPTGKRRRKANLQRVFIPEDIQKKAYKEFAGKKVTACTKCIKAISK
jgi:ribosomal protein L28